MKKTVLLFMLVLMVGCAGMPGMPGSIEEQVSQFDGSREIKMRPAWVGRNPSIIKFGLHRTSKMPENEIALTVLIKGANLISRGESLQFNIDGEVVSMTSVDDFTDIETTSGHSDIVLASNWSSKRYVITKEFIDKLLAANRVAVKVELSKSYAEGLFSDDFPVAARPAFREFRKRVYGY